MLNGLMLCIRAMFSCYCCLMSSCYCRLMFSSHDCLMPSFNFVAAASSTILLHSPFSFYHSPFSSSWLLNLCSIFSLFLPCHDVIVVGCCALRCSWSLIACSLFLD